MQDLRYYIRYCPCKTLKLNRLRVLIFYMKFHCKCKKSMVYHRREGWVEEKGRIGSFLNLVR